MNNRITRRRFIKHSTLATAAITSVSTRRARAQANDRLQLAFIGTGGRGGANLGSLTRDGDVDVVALCDVNSRNLNRAAKKFPKARTYADFRKLYENVSDIDAVVVSTCEHTHAYATMPALKNKKHVYCEKPLTYNVYESRRIQLEAERAGVATQMGTQIHANSNYRRVVELVQSGAIGAVNECHVWVGRAWGLQSEEDARKHKDRVYVTERPTEAQTPPDYLDWDLWLGPAPERPYHEVYFPGPKWYRWWDFGNGTMSDLGSHWNDLPFWALNLDAPTTIEAFGPDPHPEIAPASMSATYKYPARGDRPALRLTWHQGTHKPQIWKDKGIPQWGSGVLFIGDKGMLLSDYGKHLLLPEDEFRGYERPKKFIADSPGHHREWLDACLNGSETGSPFSYAGPLTEANHLGNVAFRAGRKLEWDAVNMRATNAPEADRFLKRDPRAGWSL
jgi:predicted dehydrogenase